MWKSDLRDINKFTETAEKFQKTFPNRMKSVMNKTSLQTLVFTKKKWPKRSGQTIKTFNIKKIGDDEIEVGSDFKPVMWVEKGTKSAIIRPKKKKILLFSTDEKNKRRDGKLKSSVKRRLFQRLKNAKSKQERYAVMKSLKTFLAKKVKKPATKGQNILKNLIQPYADKKLIENTQLLIERMLKK